MQNSKIPKGVKTFNMNVVYHTQVPFGAVHNALR